METVEDSSKVKLPFGPPPIMPDVKTELQGYITDIERLHIYHIDKVQCYWGPETDVLSLLRYDLAPISTTLKFDRDPITGQLADMQEIVLKGAGETSKNSMSMNRAPGPATEEIRGNPSNFPFWPGGFDEPKVVENTSTEEIDFEKNLRTLAKGFSFGIEFQRDNCTPKEYIQPEHSSSTVESEDTTTTSTTKIDKINLMAIVHEEKSMLGLSSSVEKVEANKPDVEIIPENDMPILEDIVDLPIETTLPDIPVLKITEKPAAKSSTKSSEWAEVLNVTVPVTDYDKKVPNPAMKFDYELDTFQKQAIIKLEENCNVFVAAHTSAGKTTVAEYAIALSQKHMTRVIYTSPIKALSNQKYRDFKNKFESVGLITGDCQINQTASCLIMTTEILQSMLYCASEVLRDLEFVIFDEVHYINDEDRGHVWEEIVILLPHNVNIVMLSATVPNPLVFADWVGRIKRRKMYVISTVKRPVPLQHYLYTGIDKSSSDKKYLILDQDEQFRLDEWHEALKSRESKKKKNSQNQAVPNKKLTPAQEKSLWSTFVRHLQSENLTPVVIFTLSRQRCDSNATLLTNLDLTTSSEKHHIHTFFKKNINYLKGSDRELPQVLKMEDLLKRGIGIHHSGILPILKEIVEMLFQNGCVKLLFATETFAMGVNMPARTVVFDSIRKYDGNQFRTLHPTEYIQMAGRAGRRGHDTTGTVIIMCKTDVPHFHDLKPMMCGQPESLKSQFKVTYRMVLNLRRANDSVSVEAMMRRSFGESPLASKQDTYQIELRKIEKQLIEFPTLTNLQKKLSQFCETAVEYLENFKVVQSHLLQSRQAKDALVGGRILLVSHLHHYHKLGILLNIVQNKQEGNQYKVLILTKPSSSSSSSSTTTVDSKSELWHRIIGLTKRNVFVPSGVPSHEVLILSSHEINKITSQVVRIDCDMILRDWEKRQILRFRNDPPGPTCQTAIQTLIELSLTASVDPNILLPYVHLKAKANNDISLRMQHMDRLYDTMCSMKFIEIPNFESHFETVFQKNQLENRKRQLQVDLSDEGLSLYPNYISMVDLLKELGYIDSDERVALKGRVALQMGTNELLITELILKNVLTVLQPAEIAALLSAIIFQQKTKCPFEIKKLPPELRKGIERLCHIHQELEKLEQEYRLCTLQPLNFGLVQVVYEWAQSMSFAEIMELTDVQEGIIVKCIQKLNETLNDVRNAAVTIGDPVLKDKMEAASLVIKRDIVFAASLYTQD